MKLLYVLKSYPKLDCKAFQLFDKSDVNGDNTNSVYVWLKKCFPGNINWNFASKFLIDQNGLQIVFV